MPIAITKLRFKKFIILFWTLWWLIALWTDIVGLLAHYGVLKKSWAPDLNYPFLAASLKMYNTPEWVAQLAFLGIIFWSFLSSVAFCWASACLHREERYWLRRADIAFIISLGYWMAFFIADQLVMKFDLEENHMVQGGFQLLTFLSLYLLPSQET
ncbi:hypothetical protein [Legionella hackeliae]|uniref:Transmembrane protein n=1 Tax=Legionella hackeliae TaxID=449 RepID=A0A0A8UV07_LEGHA|nr:hypothetical protein [Legionella hackeliae]KTD15281.1 hypothetical protein Lhac_0123 [Legionella hackeliae]CEK11351.1 membrane protein of unknown function [Legionella hackeliae]STX48123.1 Uncharacterised protein [Legionella hackeliae]